MRVWLICLLAFGFVTISNSNGTSAQEFSEGFVIVGIDPSDGLTFYTGDPNETLTRLETLSGQFSLQDQNLDTEYIIPEYTQMALSPDNQVMAMVAQNTATPVLALVQAGNPQSLVVALPTIELAPLWSPDSSKIALIPTFVDDASTEIPSNQPTQVIIYDRSNEVLTPILSEMTGIEHGFVWSSDSTRLLYNDIDGLYSIATDDTPTATRLAEWERYDFGCNTVWSPFTNYWYFASPCSSDGLVEMLAIYSVTNNGVSSQIHNLATMLPEGTYLAKVTGVHPFDSGVLVTLVYWAEDVTWRVVKLNNDASARIVGDYPRNGELSYSVVSPNRQAITLVGLDSFIIVEVESGRVIAENSDTFTICNLQWVSNTQIIYGLQQPECNGVASESLGVRYFDIVTGRLEDILVGLDATDVGATQLLLPR